MKIDFRFTQATRLPRATLQSRRNIYNVLERDVSIKLYQNAPPWATSVAVGKVQLAISKGLFRTVHYSVHGVKNGLIILPPEADLLDHFWRTDETEISTT